VRTHSSGAGIQLGKAQIRAWYGIYPPTGDNAVCSGPVNNVVESEQGSFLRSNHVRTFGQNSMFKVYSDTAGQSCSVDIIINFIVIFANTQAQY
jgi:hypothetical protein